MHRVLFVCTANIFRSRFSEEVYNHLANRTELPSRAFSAGLKVGNYTTRKIYFPALEQLKSLNIVPKRRNESSIHIENVDLKKFNKIICMDQSEHKPMVNENPKLNEFHFDYWDIVDEPAVPSNISLPKCYRKVEKLIEQYSRNFNS